MSHGRWFSVPFYNPYLLVSDTARIDLLRRQWKRLLDAVPLYIVNTESMEFAEAKERIWEIVSKK